MAKVITDRLVVLGWRQRQLAERANVSQAIVRELQYDTNRRRRSARTLEALSVALGLHPSHLLDVALGVVPKPAQLPDDHSQEFFVAWVEDQARLMSLVEDLHRKVDELRRSR
ncbi:helix-turn-helix domain-containing protein [Actinokineospora terrae]|uniref:helix-turn-helix domain-containing protein n=1 Tax=Actinokineospora terrae TaxID=155974 RepID=UPI001FE7F70C|nr:helix-turn-helix transcriptional regulator [Actinokineospora terrae]